MELRKLVEEAKKELELEKREEAIEIIKERLAEIRGLKKVLSKAEKQFEELLAKEIDDVV